MSDRDTPVPCAVCGFLDGWKTLDAQGRTVCGERDSCAVSVVERNAESRGVLDGMREALRIAEAEAAIGSGSRPTARSIARSIRAEIERREKA